jgi:hypothetical protein
MDIFEEGDVKVTKVPKRIGLFDHSKDNEPLQLHKIKPPLVQPHPTQPSANPLLETYQESAQKTETSLITNID